MLGTQFSTVNAQQFLLNKNLSTKHIKILGYKGLHSNNNGNPAVVYQMSTTGIEIQTKLLP